MVKIAILGASTPLAGEIIRILINHPETELISLVAPTLTGRSVSSVHHGLIGETQLNFTDRLDLNELDLLLVMDGSQQSKEMLSMAVNNDNLKVVVAIPDSEHQIDENGYEFGLSEINRKALVRGATKAIIPSPVVVPALIALVPLAKFLLLNSDILIDVTLPEDIAAPLKMSKEENFIAQQLQKFQNSFNCKVILHTHGDKISERAMYSKIILKTALSQEEIEKIFEQAYEDHNFTFLSRNEIVPEEVEGTQKTIIHIDKIDSDTLEIDIVNDARMRGGAGDIVHVMNLFFGLHEKTGLHFKSSSFFKKPHS